MDDLLDALKDKSELEFKDVFIRIWTEPRQVYIELLNHGYKNDIHILFFVSGIGALLNLGPSTFLDELPSIVKIIIQIFAGGCLAIFLGYFTSFCIHLTGKWFKGEAAFRDILKVTALSYIPNICILILELPFYFFSSYFSDIFQGNYATFASISTAISVLSVILSIWALVILVIGISVVQEFTIGKAILNMAILLFIGILLSIFLFTMSSLFFVF